MWGRVAALAQDWGLWVLGQAGKQDGGLSSGRGWRERPDSAPGTYLAGEDCGSGTASGWRDAPGHQEGVRGRVSGTGEAVFAVECGDVASLAQDGVPSGKGRR